MTYVLALDPGYKKSGIALFKGDRLYAAFLLEVDPALGDLAEHWQHKAGTIDAIVSDLLPWDAQYDTAAEIMQVDDRTGKAQAKQLLQLSGLAGAVSSLSTGPAQSYAPSEWNKNRPKGPNHAKILRALTDQEKEDLLVESEKITDGEEKSLFRSLRPPIVDSEALYYRAVDERTGQAEHVLDAVGIGLYHLGRLR